MIVGLGLDVVDVARIGRALARHGERFTGRCFAPDEIARAGDPKHLAGLFAAKEAAFKALGAGWDDGVGWRDVRVGRAPSGAPFLELSGAARRCADRLGVARSHLSISHDAGLAVAVVVLES